MDDTIIDRCPSCGEDTIEASARIYVSRVKVNTRTGCITEYEVDFVAPGDAVHDAFIGEGAGFSDQHIYCDCGWTDDEGFDPDKVRDRSGRAAA